MIDYISTRMETDYGKCGAEKMKSQPLEPSKSMKKGDGASGRVGLEVRYFIR